MIIWGSTGSEVEVAILHIVGRFMNSKSAFFALFAVFIAANCSRREPMENNMTTEVPILSMQNFRSLEKDGYTVEAWTTGLHGFPISIGYRVCLPTGHDERVPQTEVRLELTSIDDANISRKAILKPMLRKTIIEGGYFENIRTDSNTIVHREEKFIGRDGVWEVVLADPLNTDFRSGKAEYPPAGKYGIAIEILIEGGPTVKFKDLPYRVYKHRGEHD